MQQQSGGRPEPPPGHAFERADLRRDPAARPRSSARNETRSALDPENGSDEPGAPARNAPSAARLVLGTGHQGPEAAGEYAAPIPKPHCSLGDRPLRAEGHEKSG